MYLSREMLDSHSAIGLTFGKWGFQTLNCHPEVGRDWRIKHFYHTPLIR